MAEVTEVLPGTPHNPVPAGHIVVLETEYNDLKHRADVSSQNFERAKKAEERVEILEGELQTLQSTHHVPSDNEDDKVGELAQDVAAMKRREAEREVKELYPQLKDVWNEFEAFRNDPENKGMNLRTAAKSFMTEKGLLDPVRKGLEAPTGGDRTPISSGMTPEDVARLRETDYKKYAEMVRKGQIKVS